MWRNFSLSRKLWATDIIVCLSYTQNRIPQRPTIKSAVCSCLSSGSFCARSYILFWALQKFSLAFCGCSLALSITLKIILKISMSKKVLNLRNICLKPLALISESAQQIFG